MRFGYASGFEAGYAKAVEAFERALALTREDLADARQEREKQQARADAAADLLLQHMGLRAITLAGKQDEVERAERSVRTTQALASIPDPTEELPFGHPNGTFKTPREASLFASEDVATAEG